MKNLNNKITYVLLWIASILITIVLCLKLSDPNIEVKFYGAELYNYEEEMNDETLEKIENGVYDEAKEGTEEEIVEKININTASKDELKLIPNVGDKTAEKIIEYREQKPFSSVEEIMKIKGIGEKKYSEMKEYIIVE